MKKGTFYLLVNTETKEETVAYYYLNPDTNDEGFGFNTANGGGFLPMWDCKSEIHELEFVKTGENNLLGNEKSNI